MDFKDVLTPRGFLVVGGVILLLLGILGFINVLGPTPEQSLFGQGWWFDYTEVVAYLVVGVVALLVAYLTKDASIQRTLVWVIAVIALVVAADSLMGGVQLLGANLESPMDLLLNLVIGVWAVVAALNKKTAKAK